MSRHDLDKNLMRVHIHLYIYIYINKQLFMLIEGGCVSLFVSLFVLSCLCVSVRSYTNIEIAFSLELGSAHVFVYLFVLFVCLLAFLFGSFCDYFFAEARMQNAYVLGRAQMVRYLECLHIPPFTDLHPPIKPGTVAGWPKAIGYYTILY